MVMNYRSAIVFGRGKTVESTDEVLASLRILSEKITPGRWEDALQRASQPLANRMIASLPQPPWCV